MKRVILSRTDSIGDVVLTLPLAGIYKEVFPDTEVIFLGSSYAEPVVRTSKFVDRFVDWTEMKKLGKAEIIEKFREINADVIIHVFPRPDIVRLAAKAMIPLRVGTSGRLYNYFNCNLLVKMSRKRSDLHESQLNIKLLPFPKPWAEPDLDSIPKYYGMEKIDELRPDLKELLKNDKINLILHPRSKGSAREWGLENYSELIRLLPEEKYRIFITGTKDEWATMPDFFTANKERIIDVTGKMDLSEFISFINSADGLVAASTGPLHIAAAMGRFALGLYAPMRPIFPKRWQPVGKNAHFLVIDKKGCTDCRNSGDCHCIMSIKPMEVFNKIEGNLFL